MHETVERRQAGGAENRVIGRAADAPLAQDSVQVVEQQNEARIVYAAVHLVVVIVT